MKPTQSMLVLLFSGAFLAAPTAYAKNDGLMGHDTGHDSAQRSAAQSSSNSSNDANGDASLGAASTAPTAANAPSTGGSSQSACDDPSASVSTGIGHCHDGGSSSDRSGDAHPSLGWQSLLPGSIQ